MRWLRIGPPAGGPHMFLHDIREAYDWLLQSGFMHWEASTVVRQRADQYLTIPEHKVDLNDT